MKLSTIALAVALTGGVAAGAYGVQRRLAAEVKPDIPTIAVKHQTIPRHVPAEGTLEAETATPVTPPHGRYRRLRIAWLMDDGSEVSEGDVLVRFDREDFEKNLAKGEDDKKSAEQKLAALRAEAKNAQTQRERQADLARIDLAVSQERKESEDDEIFSRNQLLVSNIDRELSSARVAHAGAASKMDRSISGAKLRLLELEKQAAELAIGRASDGLSRMEVRAPHDGLFVYEDSEIAVGSTVYRGQNIGKLPKTSTMQAEVFVLETDVKGLEEGQLATVTIESQPDTQYKATIAKIATLAQPRHREVPIQYFKITLALEKTDESIMKPGQRVRAELALPTLDGLVVPRQCIFQDEGDLVVYRKSGANFDTVPVKLGAGTPGLVVVAEGLSPGDEIASRDPFGRAKAEDEDGEGGPAKSGGAQ